MSELHVLGIGSPFGDDQLGFHVIQLLQQQPDLSPINPQKLHLDYCDRPGMHLLELMKPAHTVFLIDAIKTGAAIGTLHCFENKEIESLDNALSTHAFGVAEAIKIGAALHILPPQIILYGIEIGDIASHISLSKSIEQAITILSVRIKNDILSFLS